MLLVLEGKDSSGSQESSDMLLVLEEKDSSGNQESSDMLLVLEEKDSSGSQESSDMLLSLNGTRQLDFASLHLAVQASLDFPNPRNWILHKCNPISWIWKSFSH